MPSTNRCGSTLLTRGPAAISACTHGHRSVPFVHDFTTNNADRIVLCTGRPGGNGNIVDRAGPDALKFIDGTAPRPIRHAATMRPRRMHARLNTGHRVCALRVSRVVGTSSEERCRIATHQLHFVEVMGFASLNPSYGFTTRSAQVICPSGALLTGVSSPICKNISISKHPKSHLQLPLSRPTRGTYHDRRVRWVRDAVDAAALSARWIAGRVFENL
jgi:hypothetical protein